MVLDFLEMVGAKAMFEIGFPSAVVALSVGVKYGAEGMFLS